VLFEVPARLRPSGWLPQTPLPIEGERRGDLNDASEVHRIRQDAKTLLQKLQAARMGREVGPPAKSMPDLIRSWQTTHGFKSKRPRTQEGYLYHARLIEAWSRAIGHKPVSGLTFQPISDFLSSFDDRPTTRRHVKIVFKMLLDQAIRLGWRTDNPLSALKMGAPESTVLIWEPEDAERLADLCVTAGQPCVAAIILTQWEIGQRMTDMRLFRRKAEYQPQDRAFRFWQSKTDSYVHIEASDKLAALLDEVQLEGSPYLFTDAKTGKPFAEKRLAHVFQAIRDAAGERPFVLRALRHSCVVQLARAGCTIAEIASVTGHGPFSAEQIISKYLPRDSQIARNAQAKRGLVRTKSA
jgi:integrase